MNDLMLIFTLTFLLLSCLVFESLIFFFIIIHHFCFLNRTHRVSNQFVLGSLIFCLYVVQVVKTNQKHAKAKQKKKIQERQKK